MFTDDGPTRLARRHTFHPAVIDKFSQSMDLSRFARAFDTFQGDEHGVHCFGFGG